MQFMIGLYIISEKSGITYSISHNFGDINTDSYDSLPLEKTITFHDVIILINPVKIKISFSINYK